MCTKEGRDGRGGECGGEEEEEEGKGSRDHPAAEVPHYVVEEEDGDHC